MVTGKSVQCGTTTYTWHSLLSSDAVGAISSGDGTKSPKLALGRELFELFGRKGGSKDLADVDMCQIQYRKKLRPCIRGSGFGPDVHLVVC
jgi:hypothetical protein